MRKSLQCLIFLVFFSLLGCDNGKINLPFGPTVRNRSSKDDETFNKRFGIPSWILEEADWLSFPNNVDSNSPAHWDGSDFYIFNSDGHPFRSSGRGLDALSGSLSVNFSNTINGRRWLEATYKSQNRKLYGWYHNEPADVCPAKGHLTAPRIGAAVSMDNGLSWLDQGFILDAPKGSNYCSTSNNYFAGGNGDFSVLLDDTGQYFYFFFSTYHEDPDEQGISMARMLSYDLDNPSGKVWKLYNNSWNEPGLGGHVSPILSANSNWHQENPDAFWGPSVHWNTHLRRYVMLLNRAQDPNFSPEGFYISFNISLFYPDGWSTPQKILDGFNSAGNWYPQIIGLDSGGTDKIAGKESRLFIHGRSHWKIIFN